MTGDGQHLAEGARVQITPASMTPAQPPAGAQPQPEETAPVSLKNPLQRLAGVIGILSAFALLLAGCSQSTTPNHNEAAGLNDGASVQSVERPTWLPAETAYVHTGDPSLEPTHYRVHLTLEKRVGDWTTADIAAGRAPAPFEVHEDEDNLLTTAGAQALFNGLSTSGLATPFNTTNAQLAVGDGTTAAAVGDTDLSAAAGSTITTSGLSACTNATPIVCTNGSGNWTSTPAVGSVVVVANVNGNTAANGTFEVSASTATTVTLLNSAGNGSFTTSSSATVKPINYYRQQANGSGSAVVSSNQIVYVATFGTSNANFHWQEWGLTTGAAATNKEAQAPPTLFNHKIVDLGTKTSSASWTLTATLSLS